MLKEKLLLCRNKFGITGKVSMTVKICLLFVLCSFVSCQKDADEPSLTGTKWQLVGYFDAQTGAIADEDSLALAHTLELIKDCNDCFVLVFQSDNMLKYPDSTIHNKKISWIDSLCFGNTSLSEFPLFSAVGTIGGWECGGFYKFDYSTSKIKFAIATGYPYDVYIPCMELYENTINKVQSFSFSAKELKLYYNDQEKLFIIQ